MTTASKATDSIDASATLFMVLLAIVMVVAISIYHAFVIQILWGWYVVPLGVPSISVAHAFGLSCLAGVFRRYSKDGQADLYMTVVGPLFLLAAGAVAKQWI